MMKPNSWPTGAKEELVRQCNCSTCEELIQQLEKLREEQSVDGEHKSLKAYTDTKNFGPTDQ